MDNYTEQDGAVTLMHHQYNMQYLNEYEEEVPLFIEKVLHN